MDSLASRLVEFSEIKEIARVFIKNNDYGIVRTSPHKARITPYLKTGSKIFTVQIINVWNNRIVGDLRNPDKKPYANTNVKYKFWKNSTLLKSGLIGKAEIFFRDK
jgi:hypothetical protein